MTHSGAIVSATVVDMAVIVAYVLAVLIIGLRTAKRAKKTSEGYYLAGRSMRWPMVGASLFSTNISAEHYVGYAGGAYLLGIVVGATELIAPMNLMILAVLFLPFYIGLRVFTISEFLEKRFSLTCRMILSVTLLAANVLTRLSVGLWGCALIMKTMLGWDPIMTVWTMGAITTVYTLFGGLSAVIYTETMQAVVMLGSGMALAALSLAAVGGPAALVTKLGAMHMADHLHWVRSIHDPQLPWTSFTLPWLVIASFYWCMDQTIVQRALSARSLSEARKGALFCGYIKLVHLFIFVLPGLCALVLFPHLAKPDEAYPKMLAGVLPIGLRGLALAAVLAALMSTLAGTLNSTATLIVHDWVIRFKPETSQRRQISIGWVSILIVAVLGMAWAPFIQRFESLWVYLMRISMYTQAPIAGIFFLGLLWRGINSRAAVLGIVAGVVLGVTCFLDDLKVITVSVLHYWFLVPFPHRGFLIVLISALIAVTVSLLWPEKKARNLDGLCINWRHSRLFESEPCRIWSDWRVWLVGLLIVDVFLYVKLM